MKGVVAGGYLDDVGETISICVQQLCLPEVMDRGPCWLDSCEAVCGATNGNTRKRKHLEIAISADEDGQLRPRGCGWLSGAVASDPVVDEQDVLSAVPIVVQHADAWVREVPNHRAGL